MNPMAGAIVGTITGFIASNLFRHLGLLKFDDPRVFALSQILLFGPIFFFFAFEALTRSESPLGIVVTLTVLLPTSYMLSQIVTRKPSDND